MSTIAPSLDEQSDEQDPNESLQAAQAALEELDTLIDTPEEEV